MNLKSLGRSPGIRGSVVLLLGLSLMVPPSASADIYVAPRARFRPPVGWVCSTWTERVSGDFDGDGRIDRGLYYERARPNARCHEQRLANRWRLSLFLGGGVRIDRRLPCLTAPTICRVAVVDLDRDGKAEIELHFDGGVSYVGVRHYWLIDGAVRRIRVRPPGVHAAGPGPMQVSWATSSGTRQGFGCRTQPDGTRVFIAYAGFPLRRAPHRWRFIRVRWHLDPDGMRVLGIREFFERVTEGEQPRLPSARACAPTQKYRAWPGWSDACSVDDGT